VSARLHPGEQDAHTLSFRRTAHPAYEVEESDSYEYAPGESDTALLVDNSHAAYLTFASLALVSKPHLSAQPGDGRGANPWGPSCVAWPFGAEANP
jgi:hypothetical protein